MSFEMLGFVFIALGIYALYFVLENKSNMPQSIFMAKEHSYNIISKKKFNNVMLLQSMSISACFMIVGVLAISTKSIFSIMIGLLPIFLHIIFSTLAKKYVEFI